MEHQDLLDRLERHDPGTVEHSRRVGDLACSIARGMGLVALADDPQFHVAATFHDVGKLLIPRLLLRRPGPLDAAEWELMRMHTVFGAGILAQDGALAEACSYVVAHHERIDGAGYPYGLAGEEIPLGARLISVADAFEAMTSGRPYQPALSEIETMTRLRLGSGTQFDLQVVTAALDILPARVAAA